MHNVINFENKYAFPSRRWEREKQLTAFQESTKMLGGDEFILRFVNTEAARLGKTVPQFLSECQSSVAIYTKTMQSLGYEN